MSEVPVRSRASGSRASAASAGMPESAADARLAELESRLARLEGEPSMKDRGRAMMDRVVPPEAGRHFRNAGREQLLGIRSIVDFWIRRIDDAEARSPGGDAARQRIEID
jgi:hypothetical protein